MNGNLIIFVSCILLACSVDCLRRPFLKNPPASGDIPPWKTFYYTQMLDHFNLKDDRTFQQRYLVNGNNLYFKCQFWTFIEFIFIYFKMKLAKKKMTILIRAMVRSFSTPEMKVTLRDSTTTRALCSTLLPYFRRWSFLPNMFVIEDFFFFKVIYM